MAKKHTDEYEFIDDVEFTPVDSEEEYEFVDDVEFTPVDSEEVVDDVDFVVPETTEESTLESIIEATPAALRGAAEGATMGFSDEIVGAAKALPSIVDPNKKLLEEYRKYKAESETSREALEEEFPKASIAGELAGGIGSGILASLATGGAGGAATLKSLATTGAALGAVEGLGKSEAELTEGELVEAGKDSIIGGTIGAAGSTVLGKLTPLAKGATKSATTKLGKVLDTVRKTGPIDEFSQSTKKLAINALDLKTGDLKKIAKQTGKINNVKDVINTALRNDIISATRISPISMYSKALRVRKSAGNKIGKVIKEHTDAEIVSGKELIDDILNDVKGDEALGRIFKFEDVAGTASATERNHLKVIENVINKVSNTNKSGKLSLKDLQDIKMEIGANGWGATGPVQDAASVRLSYNRISNKIDSLLDDLAKKSGNKAELADFLDAKKTYAHTKFLTKHLEGKVAKELAQKPMDFMDTMSIGMSFNPSRALAASLLRKAPIYSAATVAKRALDPVGLSKEALDATTKAGTIATLGATSGIIDDNQYKRVLDNNYDLIQKARQAGIKTFEEQLTKLSQAESEKERKIILSALLQQPSFRKFIKD